MAHIDSFMGFSKVSNIISYADKFDDRFLESDSAFLESKEVFEHDDENNDGTPLKFKYKYCIEADYCEGKMYYSLQLVPMPESLNDELRQKVADSACVEVDELDVYDICSYGLGILVAHDSVEGEEVDDDVLNFIASIFECVNGMRGFYLDRYQNRIGTTGWDIINQWLYNIDPFMIALDRYK